ncbi:hypothetical protein [Flavobacterium sp.]|uniref:hypothetical protein n=1 Tax=Flavobacterium sp. TaxID=239 RepID=UPI004034149C
MTSLENIRHSLIDRILATKNENFLKAITAIFDSSQIEEIVELSSEQIEILQMSEDDIANGRLISDEDLKASDPEWLR